VAQIDAIAPPDKKLIVCETGTVATKTDKSAWYAGKSYYYLSSTATCVVSRTYVDISYCMCMCACVFRTTHRCME
jgi:hypothetical protein